MLAYVEKFNLSKKIEFSFKARKGLQKQKCCRQNSAQGLSLLDLRKIFETISKNQQMDPKFPGD